MSDDKPWSPTLEKAKEFRDHINPELRNDPPLRIPEPTEDTAPLQGSKDLSDEDSLEDVIADSFEPDPEAPATNKSDIIK
jgi:hypothetical protein